MRDPKRIPLVLKRLLKIWKKNPDLRLGQLIANVFQGDTYYYEDEEFIKNLEAYYGLVKKIEKTYGKKSI